MGSLADRIGTSQKMTKEERQKQARAHTLARIRALREEAARLERILEGKSF